MLAETRESATMMAEFTLGNQQTFGADGFLTI